MAKKKNDKLWTAASEIREYKIVQDSRWKKRARLSSQTHSNTARDVHLSQGAPTKKRQTVGHELSKCPADRASDEVAGE